MNIARPDTISELSRVEVLQHDLQYLETFRFGYGSDFRLP